MGGGGDDERLGIITTWIFTSQAILLCFSILNFSKFVIEKYAHFSDPADIKHKTKCLGGYSPTDPLRKLPMRESIYTLAFAVNLDHEQLAKYEE